MVRLAQSNDIPWIAKGILALKPQLGWAQYQQSGFNEQSLTRFLHDRLVDPRSILHVCNQAFCGGSLNQLFLPPHPFFIFEWGWFGPRKDAVRCWQAVTQWGKRHGATLANRSQSQPGSSATRFTENQIWKVL